MNNLFGLIKHHGWLGFKSFIKLKTEHSSYVVLQSQDKIHVYVSGHPDVIYLRGKSSDYPTFKQVFEAKEYEIDFNFTPKFIVDAGANIGLASIYFSQRFESCQILAIEPEASNIEMMHLNLKNYPNVNIAPFALHHTADDVLEIADPGIGNWGFITETSISSKVQKSVIAKVKTISIDAILSKYNVDIIDILKIDIEGAEKSLFQKNYEKWLPRTRCIIVELHDRFYPGCKEVVMNAIEKYDFRYFEKGENVIFINNQL